jgi:hypothetical protein
VRRKPKRVRRIEPRPLFPIREGDDALRCDDIELVVHEFDGFRHLPVVELRASA